MKTRQGRMVVSMAPEKLVLEYLTIKKKKSKLSRRERDLVEGRVEYLISKGWLERDGDDIKQKANNDKAQ